MRRNNIFLIFGTLLLICSGCGQTLTDGINNNPNQITETQSIKSETIKEFNEKLDHIEDEQSALEAVTYFATYVEKNRTSRTKDQQVVQNQITSESPSVPQETLLKFAKIELARKHPSKFQITEESNQQVSTKKLTNIMNSINLPGGAEPMSEDEVDTNRKLIKTQIPNLGGDTEDEMTPLEASVISFYMLTGNAGKESEESQLVADQSDIDVFTEKLLEEDNNE